MIQLAIKLSVLIILFLSTLLGSLLWDKYSIKDITQYKERTAFKTVTKNLSEKEKRLLGSWVEPTAEIKKGFQGFTLYSDGTAKSINTGELMYKTWKIHGNEIFLRVETLGEGFQSQDIESYVFEQVSSNILLLKIGQSIFKYKRILS
jgi:hypothetical protein